MMQHCELSVILLDLQHSLMIDVMRLDVMRMDVLIILAACFGQKAVLIDVLSLALRLYIYDKFVCKFSMS